MTFMETGVADFDTRLGIYLTNSLEPGSLVEKKLLVGLAHAVSEESRIASEVKMKKPIMVIIGNPPYQGHSSNDTEYANGLVEKYKVEPGGEQKLKEKNSKWLKDDYVKFIAMAEEMIEKNGEGVLAMITNNGYIDNPTFRGMRWHLSNTFDKIKILDLHGSLKKQETTPEGHKDENVFNIEQGVSILLAIKTSNHAKSSGISHPKILTMKSLDDTNPAKLFHSELYGKRVQKFRMLEEKIEWTEFEADPESYDYAPIRNPQAKKEYSKFIDLSDLFLKSTYGTVTSRDSFAVAQRRESIEGRMQELLSDEPDAALREKYNLNDNRDWQLANARERLRNQSEQERQSLIQPYLYRPFDPMFTYLDEVTQDYPRTVFKEHVFNKDNLVLGASRQGLAIGAIEWCLVTVSRFAIDANIFRRGGVMAYPLYLYGGSNRSLNLNEQQVGVLLRNMGSYNSTPSLQYISDGERDAIVVPEDIFDYIYAILHSPSYREKYSEFLKNAFPRIPPPRDGEIFWKLRDLGRKLRELHLMEISDLNCKTTFPIVGSNIVEKVVYRQGNVYFNSEQYFGNVPETAWNFFVGGYQPAQKWLKDRKSKTLRSEDIEYYQRVISILRETQRLMARIDAIWRA